MTTGDASMKRRPICSYVDGRSELSQEPMNREDRRETGAPAATIVKAARDWAADLMVIASHGRSSASRALLGSVAEGVMRNAPCPVLVVRAQT